MSQSIPALLRAHGLSPQKRLGQNFLVSPPALQRIVDAADLESDDLVLEVGAGLGTLTRPLAQKAGQVIAIEIDDGLVGVLRSETADLTNVRIVHDDVLKIRLDLPSLGFKMVGNLPYYVTSAVLRRFLEEEPRPRLMVVTVQREVATRIVAKPGKMSLLAVSVQFYGQPSIVTTIRAGAFYPVPKVDSAVLRVTVDEEPRVHLGGCETREFFRVVKAGFGQRRKTLRNALSGGLHMPPASVSDALQSVGIDPMRRAQTLDLDEWAAATGALMGGNARL